MFAFEERTEAEKGFAKIWDDMIRPGLEDYAVTYKKSTGSLLGVVAAAVLFFGFIGHLLVSADATALDTTQSVLLIAVLLVSMALVYVGYAGYENLEKKHGPALQAGD